MFLSAAGKVIVCFASTATLLQDSIHVVVVLSTVIIRVNI